mgnify:CR=1 FL=1
MTSLADHHASSLVKMLYIGDSGTGKTGSLVSLVDAGYKVHVLDMDNGLDVPHLALQRATKLGPDLFDQGRARFRVLLVKADMGMQHQMNHG